MATRTARQVITDAFHRMGLVAEDESVTAPQSDRGLSVLNDLMNGFEADGIQYVHSDVTLDSVINVPDYLVRSVGWMLLKDLSDEYGKVLTQSQMFEVANARGNLQAYFFRPPVAQTDEGIIGRRVGTSTITFLRD